MAKRILSIMAILSLVVSLNTSSTFAADNSGDNASDNVAQVMNVEGKNEVSQQFVDYIGKVFKDLDGVKVVDPNGVNVTKDFIESNKSHFYSGDYKEIKQAILDKKLSLTYVEQIQDTLGTGESSKSATLASGESVTKKFYHMASDSKGHFTKEWVVTLSGSFSYGNDFRITSVNGPYADLSANFGWGISTSLSNINTGNSYSGTRASFNISYNMTATVGIPVWGPYTYGVNVDFGSFVDSFDAYPSGMQNIVQ
ncbi:hypothetical protein RQP50_18100 [Paenibacillus sp. chi10]|uniref:Uncharacterized protein n=1 Tax=Paenibacillus suaedae TaxID=3077233 RepID=A0AAJ2K116_9BACL|nr:MULTISPECIES: hypothetical protein [unclassified Paenibacillus]MDT8978142.1 hypothetical protein [Paenibacillus sp. chi10]GAV14905.1 hypothetical protein PBN151_4884 [Paenibacillus sp. NAIST15-1]